VVAIVMMASNAPASKAQTIHPGPAPTGNPAAKLLSPVAQHGLDRPFMLMGSPGGTEAR
jgi:hypothetical protein